MEHLIIGKGRGDALDNRFDTVPLTLLSEQIESAIKEFQPTIIFTHSRCDLNIDHRLVHAAVRIGTRPISEITKNITVLAFETASSTEWGPERFNPTVYVPIDKEDLASKLTLLHQMYKSEMREFPHPRSNKYLTALATIRGAECGHELAEAFEVIRIVC